MIRARETMGTVDITHCEVQAGDVPVQCVHYESVYILALLPVTSRRSRPAQPPTLRSRSRPVRSSLLPAASRQ